MNIFDESESIENAGCACSAIVLSIIVVAVVGVILIVKAVT